MFNALRGVFGRGQQPSQAQKSIKNTGRLWYGNGDFDGTYGRNASFTADKWGAAAAVINIPYVMAIVKKIVSEFEAINYRIVNNDGETVIDRDNIGNDPLFLALNRYSDERDGFGLFAYWALHKFITGEAYIELLRNDYGVIRGLDTLNSLFVRPQTNGTGSVLYYTYGGAGHYLTFAPEQLVIDRFKENIFTEIHGTPPLLSALNGGQLSTLKSAGMATLAYFENDGLPRSIITPTDSDGMWTIKDMDDIKKALQRNKGAGGKYLSQIFPRQINVDIFDIPELDKWVESIGEAKKDIFAAYGIPPSVVGLSFDTRYQVSEQDPVNYRHTIATYMRQISAVVNTSIMPAFGYDDGLTFEFDLSPYQVISQENVDRANMAFMQGAINLNEYRTTLGYAEIEGAENVYMVPAGSQVITQDQLLSGQIPQELIETSAPMLPVRNAPQLPESTDKAFQDSAGDELKAWRKVASKSRDRALDFECYHLETWIQDHIRSGIKAGVDIEEIFNIDLHSLPRKNAESAWQALGMLDMMKAIEDAETD